MKILTLHCDYIRFRPVKKALKQPEELSKEKEKERYVEECLVVFYAVEKEDEKDYNTIIKNLIENVKEIADKIKCNNIVLYPYAHLSSNLASPKISLKISKVLEESFRKYKEFNITRAPFGYYKEFELRCKGHPLAELSREISASEKKEEKIESAAIKAEKKVKKEYFILTPDEELIHAEKFDFSNHPELRILYQYETTGTRLMEQEPPHIKLMRKHELVDYEPASDSGNLRWYPKGELMKRLMEERVTSLLIDAGAMQVETPIMYDFDHPALSAYLNRFPARQYVVISDDKKFFLRFSACFGQYMMKHDMQISYKDLPLKLYELTHYSFRREQTGELAGLKRLRAFTMPDMHTLCKDIREAREEFIEQYKLSMQYMKDIGIRYDVLCRFEKQFFNENKDFALSLVKLIGKPILIEIFDQRYAYFVMKFEFSVNDALNKASTLSTVQIDVENARRFDITYINSGGKETYPLILHASISGSIDRDLFAILEQQAIAKEKGRIPMFPFWLSPTQVRVIPISDKFIEQAIEIAQDLNYTEKVRCDVDDRDLHVQKKILEAEQEWVPYIICIGKKELEKQVVSVRIRKEGCVKEIKPHELRDILRKEQQGMPWRPLPLPMLLSKRPRFR